MGWQCLPAGVGQLAQNCIFMPNAEEPTKLAEKEK